MASTKKLKEKTTKAKPAKKPRVPSKLRKRGNPNPNESTRIKKGDNLGQTKGSKGIVMLDREEREVNMLDRNMVKRYISQNFHLTRPQILEKIEQCRLGVGTVSIFEMGICKIMLHAADYGDHFKMDFLLDRMIGKVKNELEIMKPSEYDDLTDEQLRARKQELTEANRVTLKWAEQSERHQAITLEAQAQRIVEDQEQAAPIEDVPPLEVNDAVEFIDRDDDR